MRRALLFVVLFLAAAPAAHAETLTYRFGPIHVSPGQNTIELAGNDLKPPADGWITGFKPNLTYANGVVPRVDVVHLHHGVWLSNYAPLFAAGEEKTVLRAPAGYGWRYRTSDNWVMNHMIHNLTPTPADVYIDYELEFVRDGTPEAAAMQEVQTLWLDVRSGSFYPVFDVHRGSGGRDGRYTFPDESRERNYTRHRMTVVAGRRAGRRPAATCTRAGCGPTCGSSAAAGRCGCSARGRSTSSRPARCRGTSRWRSRRLSGASA